MRILLGITGSIAAYRSPDLVRRLVSEGHLVDCVLTQSAAEFVTARTLSTFSGRKVHANNPFDSEHMGTDHIAVARWAEVTLVYGATAEFLAKLAGGFAGDFLTLQISASRSPLVVVPAMNPTMWESPAVQDNVAKLRDRGVLFVGPSRGVVACGEEGFGHVADLDEVVSALKSLRTGPLKNKRILISCGPMQSAIDPVRTIQNSSSGLTGLELARAARKRGAEVQLLLGPVDKSIEVDAVREFSCMRYVSPADYSRELESAWPKMDAFVSAAAVLDFEVLSQDQKIHRDRLNEGHLDLKIRQTPDFVARVSAAKKPNQKTVAFALEVGTDDEILNRAQEKLEKKRCDWIVANRASKDRGPGAELGDFWILSKGKVEKALLGISKTSFADELFEFLGSKLFDGNT